MLNNNIKYPIPKRFSLILLIARLLSVFEKDLNILYFNIVLHQPINDNFLTKIYQFPARRPTVSSQLTNFNYAMVSIGFYNEKNTKRLIIIFTPLYGCSNILLHLHLLNILVLRFESFELLGLFESVLRVFWRTTI
ncbi:hypothetical protein BpHYR1_002334, partial [Brachionus plicatilis]